jgi:preprotein translocase subunit SecA
MSNPAFLLHQQSFDLGSQAYLERADVHESAPEEFLKRLNRFLPVLPKFRQRYLAKFVSAVNQLESELKSCKDSALVARFWQACSGSKAHGLTDDVLIAAFAAVREASRRMLGMRHHDVQLMGGWALMNGMIAEMETGEGKTLVATLATCTAAGAGAATHVITVNDYLAKRDCDINRPLYEFLGLTADTVIQGMTPQQRQQVYARDIVYVSNKEIVFDYLKDQIASGGVPQSHLRLRKLYSTQQTSPLLLRGLHFAIVDEADSVLIDEARTPLIISETEADEHGPELYSTALSLAAKLNNNVHYVMTRDRQLWITPEGQQQIRSMTTHLAGVWRSEVWRNDLLLKALTAIHCYRRDEHYILAEEKIQIVDEFTGRVMPDRSWEHGLHQMIEVKENCTISGRRRTLSQMTYQRFFRRYLRLAGMTGTAAEIRGELSQVYDLEVLKIPTNKPSLRKRLPDVCLPDPASRWETVVAHARTQSSKDRAVLIGTRSVEASESLARVFAAHELECSVLNARQDATEAQIVASAGQTSRITIATNMAGRGTDIKLDNQVRENGGLHVILTEFHESARIDRQLFGRCARQGDPGTIEAIVSLDDEVFLRFVPALQRLARWISVRKSKAPEFVTKLLVIAAQRKAERENARIRRTTLKEDRRIQRLLAFAGKAR